MEHLLRRIYVGGYSSSSTPKELSYGYGIASEHTYAGFLTDFDSVRFIENTCDVVPIIAGLNIPYSGIPNDIIIDSIVTYNNDEKISAFSIMINKQDFISGSFDEIFNN